MEKIEKWIRQVAARYIASGQGQWAESPESIFGKPIYQVSEGDVTIVLSQTGFKYDGPSSSFECRYDEIETISPPTLKDYMLVRGDPDKLLATELRMHSAPARREVQIPARMGWVVATLLSRIVSEFA